MGMVEGVVMEIGVVSGCDLLSRASHPPKQNPRSAPDDSVVVRLQWSPLLDDGGANISEYEIFVSEEVRRACHEKIGPG